MRPLHSLSAALWQVTRTFSWAFTAFGAVLILFSGVIANGTISNHMNSVCGSAKFCLELTWIYFFFTVEGWLSIFGLAFSGLGSAANRSTAKELDSVKLQLDKLNTLNSDFVRAANAMVVDARSFYNLFLKEIFKELNLDAKHRISLYVKQGDKYFIVGRFSLNADFNSTHRLYYDSGQGIIHDAWVQGQSEFDVYCNPVSNVKGYCDEVHSKYRIPVEVVNGFNMKSRGGRALAIRHSRTNLPIATLCVEGLERLAALGVSFNDLNRYTDLLRVTIEALESHISRLNSAMQEGL